jgi:hypothetical protein
MTGCASGDKRRTAFYVPRDDDRAMILIHQRIVPRSRTGTGSLWEASTEIGGKTYSAASRHGAPQALARVLLAAGIPDQPVEVRSEICVFDDGKTIRTEELKGCIRYRSLHAMARYTFQEGDRPLHRVSYTERPEGVFSVEEEQSPEGLALGGRGRQKCVSSLVLGQREGPAPNPSEIGASAPAAEMRFSPLGDGQECVSSRVADGQEVRLADAHGTHAAAMRCCEGCDGDFLPARPWSRFCSAACRLRAHRRLARKRETYDQPQLPSRAPKIASLRHRRLSQMTTLPSDRACHS